MLQYVQTVFEFTIMSVLMIDMHSPQPAEPFYLRQYYNLYVCAYQFCMFLSKLSIFVFINRRIELYALAQFVICALTGYFALFCG